MKLEQFLRHHGITGNPFSEEDAQTDTVFKRLCLATIHHPAWNKFFGSPADPSTALVFGEKGSGKTALRLQAAAELEAYNQANPTERVFAISYDDFNPYLDSCRSAMRASKMDAVLESWRASGPHGRHSVARRDEAGRPVDVGKGRARRSSRSTSGATCCFWPRSTMPRRASRSRDAGAGCAAGRGFRPLWTRRDLQIGFGTSLLVIALIAAVSSFQGPEHSALALGADAGRLALLGLAAGPRRVVCSRHSQGAARARAAIRRPCGGSCSGSSPPNSAASHCRPPRAAAPKNDMSSCASFKGCSILWATRASSS